MIRLSFIFITLLLVFSSCVKSKEKNVQASKDFALVQTNISYIAPLVIHTIQSQAYFIERMRSNMDTLNATGVYNYISGDTVDIANENVIFEILYTQSIDIDEAFKNGSLIVEFDNYFDIDSAECSISMTDFSINNHIVSGTMTVKRIGSNQFEIKTNNFKVFIGTRQISYQGVLTCNMGTGSASSLLYDNQLEVDETGMLVDRFGALVQTIGTQLKRNFSCNWYATGITEIEDAEGNSQILDFGNGTCDNLGLISSGDTEINFAFEH